ncbi:hypothetical protein KM043_015093 [Ampulex compressa]|nr:hypothetical protein KM043_015093 [Ampulex compressa]
MADNNQERKDASDSMEVDPQENGFDTDEEGGLRVDEEIYIPPPPRSITEFDTNAPRLMITKIVNENFKSYAGIQTVGPFHKCFSAIVGPNGSGKSNVIDSMLFVFGYRATKIRSKKISVLIHNSSQHPNITKCTVSVHFQRIIDKPGADYDVVPNSEFVISRVAFKDNSSYYELNKKKVQFKEIAKLLRSHGVDLDHNRFLILQGEVEQIALMKPKGQNENDTGMLEFLEDIIGTVRYKEPLEKLSEKVEVLTERRVEKLNRLRVVEKEKAALEEPLQDAVKYLKVENEITKLQYQLYYCKRHETSKELAEQEKKTNELDKDLSNLVNEIKAIHEEKEVKNREMKEKAKKWDKLQQLKDETTVKFDKIRKQDESLHAELVETNKRRKANSASVKSEKAKIEELHRIPEKNAASITECEHLVERYMADREKEEAALATLMAGLREKTEPLLDERSAMEKDLIDLRKNVDEAKSAFDIAQSELDLYTSTESTERHKLEKLKESFKCTIDTLNERKKQLSGLVLKIPATEKSLQRAQEEFQEVKDQEAKMTSELKKKRIIFEEQRSAMQASRSRNKILDSLMQQKREGRIPGIFGRLGDLGAIDAKYDVAISTACGPLDNIIVDTVATAQACITYLREHDIGRATFIPLEKQQRFLSKCHEKINTPEDAPRLFDLIKVEDERVLPAFYYSIQDTLVAKDLDQATRIAYGQKRFRVVTLKGELIELSGTMSGGGRTVFKGRMGQKVVRNEPSATDIEKLQSELDVVFEECNRLRAKQQPLENQIYTLSTALKDMKVNKQKCDIEIQTLSNQEPSLRSQLNIQEKKAAESVSDPKKVQSLTKTVELTKKRFEEVEKESQKVEKEVARINAEIDKVSGSRVKDQQEKISKLTKQLDKAKAEICRLQVAIKTAERNVKKTEQRIETLENDVQSSEQRLRDIQQEKLTLEEQAKEILAELKEVTDALAEKDSDTSTVKDAVSALQARENKMKGLKIDLDQKMSECKQSLRQLKDRIPEYTRRIADLKLRAVPGETLEPLKEITEEELQEMDENVVNANLQKAKRRLPSEIPNMQVIDDYQQKDTLFLRRAADLEGITVERNKLRDIYETARRRRMQEFLAGFGVITGKLKEMYQMITLGGDAELELVDSLDPFSEGIVFSVRPPKKSWKNISNLSGGEKTLSSLALVFALHHYKPTPLYFMDEIDAALDFKNVSIVGNYIKERTKNAQFIVISLRSNMFELADYLVGIYKTYNCTKSVSVNLGKYYENNGIAPPTQITSSRNPYTTQTQTQKTSQCVSTHRKEPPARNGITSTQVEEFAQQGNANTGLSLPELGLCPTPEKTGVQSRRSNMESPASVKSNEEESSTIGPSRKKRRL